MTQNVLLIDDSKMIHSLVSMHFREERIELHGAFNGDSGLGLAAGLRPDLILLDVDMPGMDGFEVCRRLQENPVTMNIPVIFLTAAGSTNQRVYGLELGAQDYISKPFDAAELVARVRAALRTKTRLDLLAATRVTHFLSDAMAPQRSMKVLPGLY